MGPHECHQLPLADGETVAPFPDHGVEPEREALLRHFEVDTRVVSYDMFCGPPEAPGCPDYRRTP